MNQYHKIITVYKRDPHNMRFLLEGQWACPELEYLKESKWIFTEKVDGTNIRVMWDGKSVTFGGKTDNAQLPMPLITKLQNYFDTTPSRQMFMEKFGTAEDTAVCFYGEGYGARIQKGGGNYKRDDVDFTMFDVKVGNMWLKREDVENIAVDFGIKPTPVVGEGTLLEAIAMVKAGMNSQWGDFIAEGLVCRPNIELQDSRGNRIITKIKHRDFDFK